MRFRVSAALRATFSNEILRPLIEPMLHPSPGRVRVLALSTGVGHPLFYFCWTYLLPQPYENLALRLLMGVLGFLMFAVAAGSGIAYSKFSATALSAILWITLPVFFTWMYLCNAGNAVWLASMGAMFLIYYQLTDWRLATLGSLTGGIAGWLAFNALGPGPANFTLEQIGTAAVVMAFCWYMALVLGVSTSNLRREQVSYTLATMGIMAHELRTPLATVALIGDVVRREASLSTNESARNLNDLAARLHTLVRNMNHQIDTQIANARLLRLPVHNGMVWAETLVREVVRDYPYRNTRERDCVQVHCQRNFAFVGSHALFSQTVDNLIKNALRAIAATSLAPEPGDIRIEVSATEVRGTIAVTDRGVGIGPAVQRRLFQPFFSTNHGTGHGLGLAFCKRVVQSVNGTISVRSVPGHGATFMVNLPLLRVASVAAHTQ